MSETKTLVIIGIFLCCLFYFIRRKQDSGRSAEYSDRTFATSTSSEHSNQNVSLKCQHSENSRKYQKDCMLAPSTLYPVLITGLGGGGTHNVAKLMGQIGAHLPHEELGDHGSVSWFYAVNDVLVRGEYPHRARLQRRSYESPRFRNVLHLLRCPMQHISSFTSHTNASYDFVRAHILKQIEFKPQLPLSVNPAQFIAEPLSSRTVLGMKNEGSTWVTRNHTDFFLRRKAVVMESGRGCPRGGQCWLHFAALSWLFWNSHIQRYSDSSYRIEVDLDSLILDTKTMISESENEHSAKQKNSLPAQVRSRRSTLFKKHRKERISSKKHKIHSNYTISDIYELDSELANEIEIVSSLFGYEIHSVGSGSGDTRDRISPVLHSRGFDYSSAADTPMLKIKLFSCV